MTDPDLPEPSMEEILASIRRIISQDEASMGGVIGASPPLADAAQDAEEDILLLTKRAPAEPGPAYAAPASREVVPAGADPDGDLVAPETALGASAAFQKLSFIVDSSAQSTRLSLNAPSPTLEDLTRDLMRPMLKSWLDQNLEAIVRARVDAEVERIARGRVR